jgi:TP901 family phage tail tape measure protein
MGALPPVFIEFIGRAAGFHTTSKGVQAELAKTSAEGGTAMSKLGKVSSIALIALGVAAAGVAIKTGKMAADFETQMTRVRTGAGESAKNMKSVGDGVLSMAGQVGQSTTSLTQGLYTVESAGYHGSSALNVLKVSAEGARVGVASLDTVTNAVTTGLNAYKLGAGEATHVMNALVATEGQGKTNMEALAHSMASILPVSAAAKVGMNEVLGAMATMTAQGTSADVAATYLRQTIGQLSNPSAKAAKTMEGLGLSSLAVSKNLGTHGLASTLTMLTDAIQKHMGPAGTVLITTLQKAAAHTSAYQKVLANLPPAQKTYIGALATMVGGTKSMMAALQLTGPHMETFKKNTAIIGEQVKKGGKGVEGWADVQKTYNQRMAEAKAAMGALGIQIGQYVLPYMKKMAAALAEGVTWLTKHKGAAKAAAITIGVILTAAVAALTASLYGLAAAAAVNPVTWIVLGVMALIAGLVLLAMNWKTVWGFVKQIALDVAHACVAAWQWVASGTAGIWHAITGSISGAWRAIAGLTSSVWRSITTTVVGAWHAVAGFFVGAWHAVVDPIVGAWRWVSNVTMTVWNAISGFLAKWWPLLLVIFMPAVALLIGLWNHFHTDIWNAAVTTWNAVSNFFAGIWNTISGAAQSAWNAVASFLSGVWHAISSTASGVWHTIARAAGAAWHAVSSAIMVPVNAIWSGLKSIWSFIYRGLVVDWNIIKSAAVTVWNAIKSSTINPMMSAWHTLTTIMGNIGKAIWGGLNSAWNSVKDFGRWFEQIGSDIVNGIIHGVESGASALGSSLKNLANGALNAAKSALGINSPSKLFADHVGSSIPEGIALGITANDHHVHNALRASASGMVDTFSQALGINSPSKVFQQLGIWVHLGLVSGLTGSAKQVESAVKKTETMLMQAYNKIANMAGQMTGSGKKRHHVVSSGWVTSQEAHIKGMEAYVAREGKVLDKLAAKRASVAANLKSAKSNLNTLLTDWWKEHDAVAANIMQGASAVVAAPTDGSTLSSSDVVENMRNQVDAANHFAAELEALQKRGLSSTLVAQIAASGVAGGTATADALMAGNNDQLKAMNNMQKSLQNAASNAGGAVATSMYGAGIKSAEGLIKGLESQQKAIDKQMLKIARSMQAAIKKALGIKSPSQVFHGLGLFIAQGLANGINAGAGAATSAAGNLLSRVSAGAGGLSMPGGSAGGTVNVHIEVHGTVIAEQQLADVVQKVMGRIGKRNSPNWTPFKQK